MQRASTDAYVYYARNKYRARWQDNSLPTTTTWPKTWSLDDDTWEQFQRWCLNWCRHSRRPSAAPSPTAGIACGDFRHSSRWPFVNPGMRLQIAALTTIAPTTLKRRGLVVKKRELVKNQIIIDSVTEKTNVLRCNFEFFRQIGLFCQVKAQFDHRVNEIIARRSCKCCPYYDFLNVLHKKKKTITLAIGKVGIIYYAIL